MYLHHSIYFKKLQLFYIVVVSFCFIFYLLVLHLPNLQNSLTDRVDFSLYLFCFYIYFKNKSISNGFFFVCLFCFLLQAHGRPAFCTSLCPRFLSHMKARPKDFCPPYYRSSKFTQQRPSSHGKVQNTHASTAPKSQMLQGEGLLMKHLDLSLLTPLSPQVCSVAKASSHQACR